MASIHFNSLADAEVLQVDFVAVDGRVESTTLMVDSGFTGISGLVLPDSLATTLGHMMISDAQTSGAIQGSQSRAWVIWQLPSLSIQRASIAIFSDITTLSFPPGVEGLAGLTFLREFDGWGAERQSDGSWRFGLTVGSP